MTASRRHFLETTAAGMALGTMSGGLGATVAAAQPGRLKVAALATTYFYLSHAYHIVGRFLDGFVVYQDDARRQPSSASPTNLHSRSPASTSSRRPRPPTWAGPRPGSTACG